MCLIVIVVIIYLFFIYSFKRKSGENQSDEAVLSRFTKEQNKWTCWNYNEMYDPCCEMINTFSEKKKIIKNSKKKFIAPNRSDFLKNDFVVWEQLEKFIKRKTRTTNSKKRNDEKENENPNDEQMHTFNQQHELTDKDTTTTTTATDITNYSKTKKVHYIEKIKFNKIVIPSSIDEDSSQEVNITCSTNDEKQATVNNNNKKESRFNLY